MKSYPFVLLVSLGASMSGFALNPAPGQFECTSTGARAAGPRKFVKDHCLYQAHPNGKEVFTELLKLAVDQTKSWSENGPNFNSIEPTRGMSPNTIRWWFDDDESNQAMGQLLQENDKPFRIFTVPKVVISATMYSFEKGKERELGLEVGAFYKDIPNNPLDTTQNSISAFTSGLFKLSAAIGNPLASYLNLGINASVNNNRSSKVQDVTWECAEGEYCEYNHTSTHYFTTPVNVEKNKIGIQISARPRIDRSRPGLVMLSDFGLTYSMKTSDKDAPVDVATPYAGRDLVMNTGQLYVIGSESSRWDVRTGELLNLSKSGGHSQFIIMIQVAIQGADQSGPAIKDFAFQADDRNYSKTEIEQMPNGRYSFQEILQSVQKVCFKDRINPTTNEPICGFQFTKMDRKFMNYRLRFRVKGELESGQSSERYWKASEVYRKKGYYQLPKLGSTKPGRYTLYIELDDSNASAKSVRAYEKVKGVELQFGYYPGQNDPLEFNGAAREYNGGGFNWFRKR